MSDRPSLRRSRRHRIFGGVCGGIAEWSGQSPGLVRTVYVVVSVISAAFPGLAVYLLLWLLVPQEPQDPLNPIPNRTGRSVVVAILVILALALLPALLLAVRSGG